MCLAAAKQNVSQDCQRSHGVLPEAGIRPRHATVELTFACRDTVGRADHARAALRLGLAHHRVLPFAARRHGLTIAEVCDILCFQKPSLERVLKEMHRNHTGRQHQLDSPDQPPVLQPKRSARRLGSLPVFPLAPIHCEWRGRIETAGLGGALCSGGS